MSIARAGLPGILMALLLLSGSANPVVGQVVAGQIVDETDDQGVPGASVVLLDQRGVPSGPRAISGDDGRFQVRLPASGVYRLEIQRLGYEQLTTLPFEIRGDDGPVTVRVVLIPRVIELDPITLEVRRRTPLSISVNPIDQLNYRAETALGDFILKKDIGTKYPSLSVESLLRTVPWARFDRAGGRTIAYLTNGSNYCGVKWWLDGFAVWEPGEPPGNPVPTGASGAPLSVGRYSFEVPSQIRDLDIEDIEGIESYRGPAETPAQFGWTPMEPFCAAIAVWTGRSRPGGRRGGGGGEEVPSGASGGLEAAGANDTGPGAASGVPGDLPDSELPRPD